MIFEWFRTSDVDQFADALVVEVQQRFPPTGIDLGSRKGVERLGKIHQALLARIESFARRGKLNLYRKARLGNRVKWALQDAGYPAQFVDAFVQELLTTVVLVSRKTDADGS